MKAFSKSLVALLALATGLFSQVQADVSYKDVGTYDLLNKIPGVYEVSLVLQAESPEKRYLGKLEVGVGNDITSYLTFTSDFDYKWYFVKNRPSLPCYFYGMSLGDLPVMTCATPVPNPRSDDIMDSTLGFGLLEGRDWIVFTNDKDVQLFFERVR